MFLVTPHDRTHPYDRLPTPDERVGMEWWNSLAKIERGYWLSVAETVAEAWTRFKRRTLIIHKDVM
jgi:hypothetical protein